MSRIVLRNVTAGVFALAATVCNAAGLSAGSYVQEGLVTHFDAIDNVRTGTHDANAATWLDLKGSASITLQDGAAWTGRYFDTTPAQHTISGMPGYYRDSLTAEVAINIISKGLKEGQTGDKYPRIFANADMFTIHFYKSNTTAQFYMNSHSKRPSTTFTRGTISVYSGDERYALAVDGEEKDTSDYPATVGLQKDAADWTLNGYSGYLHGHYYAFRFYNRMLSMDEIVKNTLIDKLRFWSYVYSGSSTTWSSVPWTLPEGAAASAPSSLTNDFAQVANATVSVVASDNVCLAGLSLEDGAKLNVAADAEVSVKVLYVEGAAVPRGVYTGTGLDGAQMDWLAGAGVVRVAGAPNATIPHVMITPGDDGWIQFGTAEGSYGNVDTYAGARREYFIGEYVDWGKYCFPPGGTNKLRLVGHSLIGAIPSNTFSTVDVSQAIIVQLYEPHMFEDGSEAHLTDNVIMRYQPGTWEYDESTGKSWRMVASSSPYEDDIYLHGSETKLRVSSDNGLKEEQFLGLFHGTGKLIFSAYGNRARFSGGFALNNYVGGFSPGTFLWIDTTVVTSRLEGITFSGCSDGYTVDQNSGYRLSGLYFGKYNSAATADHELYLKFVNGTARTGISTSTGIRLRGGSVLGIWGGNTIHAGYLTENGSLHVITRPQDQKSTFNGWQFKAIGVGDGNLVLDEVRANSRLYLASNVNVKAGSVLANARFDYTFVTNETNISTLDITNSCVATATVVANDIASLPARISGFGGVVSLVETGTKSYTMPMDMTQGTGILYNTVGCIGSGTLAGAPASGTINATFPAGATLAKGDYALARFSSGGDALAGWPVTLNGQARDVLQVKNMNVTVMKDSTGLWLKVRRSGLTIVLK